MLRAHKLGKDDFTSIGTLKPKDHGKALCRGQFDAVFAVVGYPSGAIRATAKKCAVNLVNLQSRQIDRLIAKSPEFSRTTIPRGTYPGVDTDTETFGYKSTLLTHANVPDQVVYELVRATFENLEEMRGEHPAWHDLQPSKMIRDSLVAQLHSGAAKYYRERGG
ncbi:TAXI family TRAP transporter solute-binding subunit [Parasedimentitalea maritima]|uniref:TAXI family TRAP transporter solute-binding subunit n=1 Tax=Parasedimentitalea maritima TaxID=2578117 RepID=A0ABY2UQ70_9RHOB|nr:TAXI family TRAP transporter solute-binding subunit [Zongyanglinia marina]